MEDWKVGGKYLEIYGAGGDGECKDNLNASTDITAVLNLIFVMKLTWEHAFLYLYVYLGRSRGWRWNAIKIAALGGSEGSNQLELTARWGSLCDYSKIDRF